MNAQSNKLATVADNIANVNTTGYKRASDGILLRILRKRNRKLQFRQRRDAGSYITRSLIPVRELHDFCDRYDDPGQWLFRRQRCGWHALPHAQLALSFQMARAISTNTGGYYLMGYNIKNVCPAETSLPMASAISRS